MGKPIHPAMPLPDHNNETIRIKTMVAFSLCEASRRSLLIDRFEPRDSRVLVTRNAVSVAQNGVWVAVVAATAKALFFGGGFIQIARHRFAPFLRLKIDPFNCGFDHCGVALLRKTPASENEITGLCQRCKSVNLIKNWP